MNFATFWGKVEMPNRLVFKNKNWGKKILKVVRGTEVTKVDPAQYFPV